MRSSAFFREHAVFTRDEFRDHVISTGGKPRTADSLLRYHTGRGHIVRVRRGLYAVVREGADAARFRPDPLLVAARAAPDAVLSHISALQLFGVLSYIMHRATFLTATSASRFTFSGVEYVPVRPPAATLAVRDAPREDDEPTIGITWRARTRVRHTTLERTVVDCLDRADLCGGISEVWRSIELIDWIDVRRAVTYALRLRSGATCARLGLILETYRDEWGVTESDLATLESRAKK